LGEWPSLVGPALERSYGVSSVWLTFRHTRLILRNFLTSSTEAEATLGIKRRCGQYKTDSHVGSVVIGGKRIEALGAKKPRRGKAKTEAKS